MVLIRGNLKVKLSCNSACADSGGFGMVESTVIGFVGECHTVESTALISLPNPVLRSSFMLVRSLDMRRVLAIEAK